jgi:thermitase
MRKISALALALFSLSLAAKSIREDDKSIPGEVLIKIRPGHMGKFLAKKSLFRINVRKELHLLSGDYFLIQDAELTSLKSMEEVEQAEPNFRYKSLVKMPIFSNPFHSEKSSSNSPADPLYAWQWGLHNTGSNEPKSPEKLIAGLPGVDLNAEHAWSLSKGSRKVIVGVVDSGVDVQHPDLKNNIWINAGEIPGNKIDDDNNGFIDDVNGWSGLTHDGNVSDGTGHGTHCSGTIGAEHDNGIGIAGIMPEVSIMALKFIDADGFGSTADAVEVIDYALRNKVDVLSNSWGGGPYSKILEDVIRKARDLGVMFVAASGNASSNNDVNAYFPANYNFSNVISVANHTSEDVISAYSNFGAYTVHVAAPGSNILSTSPNGNYDVRSGTSMAAPHVAGAIGLLIAQEGRLPVSQIRSRLMNTAISGAGYQGKVASGRINLYQLLTK